MKLTDLKSFAAASPLSIHTLRKYAKQGMPHYRAGHKILVDPEEAEAWIRGRLRGNGKSQIVDIDKIIESALAKN